MMENKFSNSRAKYSPPRTRALTGSGAWGRVATGAAKTVILVVPGGVVDGVGGAGIVAGGGDGGGAGGVPSVGLFILSI